MPSDIAENTEIVDDISQERMYRRVVTNQMGIAEQFVERRRLAELQSVIVHEAFGADQRERRVLRWQSERGQLLRSHQTLVVPLVQTIQH